MTSARALLRCAALSLAVASSSAFAPSTESPLRRQQVSLSAASGKNDNARLSPTANTRRSFLDDAVSTTAAAVAATLLQPHAALAADDDDDAPKSKVKPLPFYIYNILRVREATEQETRLISTGKFKDAKRNNVKVAVKFILNNYKLSESVIAASSYLKGNKRYEAGAVGQSAVQSLYTIVEYFDASDVENIKVDTMAGKEVLVNSGLKSVRKDIDEFLSMFPTDVVEESKARIMAENQLNYEEFDPALGSILNPNPVKAKPIAAVTEVQTPKPIEVAIEVQTEKPIAVAMEVQTEKGLPDEPSQNSN